ncbi:hypothetical protein HAHE_07420 [Haloferula helveola]|uniref:Uncharacterized protein n=1 Tax=Haloferula helveola TaxID=490095 RepID=A0ABN6GZY0_9BACT|nr:hypothetical protein HAHE_07420 [Haloferula helveola]
MDELPARPPADALLMANILASRAEEWNLLEMNLDRIRPQRSSLIVDLWDSEMTPADVWKDYGPVLERFEQVLFLKIGRRDEQDRHLRSSLTYYRHWLSCLDLVRDDELPTHVIQLDARYQDAIDLAHAFEALESPDVFAVTCYQNRDLSRWKARWMAIGEGRKHGIPFKIRSKDAFGYRVLGPWFSTRYFVMHKCRIPSFLKRVKSWPESSQLRMEYHLCGLLSDGTELYVHDPR